MSKRGKYTSSTRRTLTALLVAGCGVPDGDAHLNLSVTPGDQPLRDSPALTGRYDPGSREYSVLHAGQELARGPVGDGDVLRFALDGRAYELAFAGLHREDLCEQEGRKGTRQRTECRTYTWLPARLTSPDGPLPGSTPTLRGAASRRFLYTALPGLLAGLLVGRAGRWNLGAGLVLALATLVGACVLGYRGFDGLFGLTHALAFLALAAAGLAAAVSWHENSRAAGLTLGLGPVVGVVPVVLAMPLWSEGSPLLAVAAGVLGVVVVGLVCFGATGVLGDPHPVTRWLLASGNQRPAARRPRTPGRRKPRTGA